MSEVIANFGFDWHFPNDVEELFVYRISFLEKSFAYLKIQLFIFEL
jgi:hypothetical protein